MKIRGITKVLGLSIIGLSLFSCFNNESNHDKDEITDNDPIINEPLDDNEGEETMNIMNVEVNNRSFEIVLEDSKTCDELIEYIKNNNNNLTISMRDYGGFEKVGSLGTSLTTDNRNITTSKGDIMLYQGNQIVIFYDSNSWSYTPLGKVKENYLDSFEDILISGNIEVTFSIK